MEILIVVIIKRKRELIFQISTGKKMENKTGKQNEKAIKEKKI